MNKLRSLFAPVIFLLGIASAQDAPKFRIYGFADMSFNKYILKDNAFIRDTFSDRLALTFDHLNIYTDFFPNDNVRMLMEIGYKHTPNYAQSKMGRIVSIEGIRTDTLTRAVAAPSNKRTGTESIEIERAIFQLKINQYANFSFGKFITPVGIWNVDHGSPVILTLRQPTQFSIMELFPKSQIGILGEGTVFIGDADLSYTLYTGTGRNGLQIEKAKDLAAGGQIKCNLPLLNEFRVGASAYTGIERTELQYMNITIDAETVGKLTQQAMTEVQSGLIGMEDMMSRIQELIGEEAQKPDNFSFTSTDLTKARENVLGLDLRLRKGRVGLQSELNYQMRRSLLGGAKGTNTLGVYGLAFVDVIKKMNFSLTPYFCYEHITIKNEKNKPLTSSPISGYNLSMAGVNTRLYSNFGVKLEYSFLDLVTENKFKDYQDNSDFPVISGQFYISF